MDVYQLNKLSLNLPFFPTDKEEKGIWLKSKQGNSRVKQHALQDLDTQTSVPDTTFF